MENLHATKLVQENFEAACREGDLEKAKAALRFGELVFPGQPAALAKVTINHDNVSDNGYHYNFFAALSSARRKGKIQQSELVDFLLNHPEFDVNKRAGNDFTPLHMVCAFGDNENLLAVRKVLANPQLKIETVNGKYYQGITALIMACELGYTEVVKRLVEVEGIDLSLEGIDLSLKKCNLPPNLMKEKKKKKREAVEIVKNAQKKKNEKKKAAASEVKNDFEAQGARPKEPKESSAKKGESDVNANLSRKVEEVRLEEDEAEDKPPPPVACWLCGKPGRFCRGCRKVAYCSGACQEQDWGSHSKACRATRRKERKEQRKSMDEVD